MVSIRTTACKWDSVIPFNKHIMITKGKKQIPMYEDEWVMNEAEKTNKSIHECREEFRKKCVDGMWNKLNKLIKPNGAIVLFGSEPFSSALRMSNIKNYKYDWYWKKNMVTGVSLAKTQPMRSIEQVVVFYEKAGCFNKQMVKSQISDRKITDGKPNGSGSNGGDHIKMNSKKQVQKSVVNPRNLLDIKCVSNAGGHKVHPTQKPVELMEYLIKTYTNEDELVLDFTAGSFSTIVACQNTNRRGVGIELDEKYFNIGVERVKNNE